MSSRNHFKRKKCRGNVDLKRGKNVAVMSCEILQCRGNVFLPSEYANRRTDSTIA